MACHVCFREDVRKRPHAGKQHYPHKCPHGVWCVTGDRLLGKHANNTPIAGSNRCEKCRTTATLFWGLLEWESPKRKGVTR